MDFLGNHYYNLKNSIIKAERRILKELGFCVHVKHPHKIIITYLQILGLEKNVALARKAWNYMNDSLRTDVFVRFSPEIVACSCIFLAARNCKVSLPLRPPWWELFDATYDDIEDIALSILRLYSRPRRKITHLESIVIKLRKAKQEAAKSSTDTPNATHGSFTPSHVTSITQPAVTALNNNNTSKPSSKTSSPVDKIPEKRVVSSVIAHRRPASDERKNDKDGRNRRGKSESDESSEYSSASDAELPTKKYAKQRKQFENKKRRSPSSDSDTDRHAVPSKIRRSVSPVDNHRKIKSRDSRNRIRDGKDSNGQYAKHGVYSKSKRKSRSPVKRGKSASPPYRKEKYIKEKIREKNRSGDKYEKHSKYRR